MVGSRVYDDSFFSAPTQCSNTSPPQEKTPSVFVPLKRRGNNESERESLAPARTRVIPITCLVYAVLVGATDGRLIPVKEPLRRNCEALA